MDIIGLQTNQLSYKYDMGGKESGKKLMFP
jgi:hypothetical protein